MWSSREMHIDGAALEILDRKKARLDAIGAASNYQTYYLEIPGLLRWILSVPVLHAYVKQIVTMHKREDAELARVVDRGIVDLPALAGEWRTTFAGAQSSDDDWPEPLLWKRFDSLAERASAASKADARREHVKGMLYVFRSRVKQVWQDAVNTGAIEGVANHYDRVMTAIADLEFAIDEWEIVRATSPHTALVRLIDLCRALQPPPASAKHWTDFLPRNELMPHVLHDNLKKEPARHYFDTSTALARFVEELHVLGASTLSRRVIVERFKERCTWYDKARLRDVAQTGSGTREDRLTLELAKYLHDSGVFVLVRPRVSNLEPDIVAMQGLAIEAKAYADSSSARADFVHGFYQLHAYMTSLETEALRVTEGVVVAFRLGGPIYETPPTIDTGRFLIHSLTIDLGESSDSGRQQPRTEKITEQEILGSLNPPTPPTP